MSDGRFVSAIDRKISNGFIASFRKDITHIKQAERKIRFITDNVTERVLTVGRKGDITFANAGV
jgi:PAS domain-containing protein